MNAQSSLFLALNFEGDSLPSQIEVIPSGASVIGRDGRSWKNLNPAKVADASNKRLPLLPIDINHATDLSAPKGGESPACGWFKSLCARKDGSVWADVEWNDLGKEALSAKKYRYLSPVFDHTAQGEINCILRAALTNSPNLELPALNSEQDNHVTEDRMKKQLCALLGASESASDEDVIAAVKALKEKPALNAAGGNSTALQVENQTLQTALNAANEKVAAAEKQLADLNAAAFKKEAESVIDGAIAAGKFTPASRKGFVSLCATQEGLASFKEIVAATPAIVNGKVETPPPPPDTKTALNSEESSFAKSAGYSEEQWKKLKEAGQ